MTYTKIFKKHNYGFMNQDYINRGRLSRINRIINNRYGIGIYPGQIK